MPSYDRPPADLDRRENDTVDQLVEEYTQRGLSRRQFFQRAFALGLTVSAASTLLAACGGTTSAAKVTSVNLLTTWGGEEQDSFKAVVAPFTQASGITVNIEATRDLDAVLTTRIRGNNPPDLAILPNPGKMQQLASQNKLIALDTFLDMNKVRADYATPWIDLGTYNGKLYAIFYKAANKATIWYSPTQFQSNGYQVPQTWDQLTALSDQIAGSGKYPWSMGVSSAAASGWPASDWVAQIYLNQSGPNMYDQWVAHKIPWTDASIKTAFQTFGRIAGGNHYINGAPQAILATGFQDASYPPFKTPPEAYMYYLGDFTAGFITTQFPSLQPGTGFNFFAFPTITPTYQGAVTGGADVVVAMKNNNGVRDLVTYLETAAAQTIWVKRGGFTSVNKSVDLSAYPNVVAKDSASQLVAAPIFRFGAGDIMPPAVQQEWWKGMLTYIGDQSQLDSVLQDIEGVAQQSYQS
ncbi:MAG: ABC transporter, substrate-binding protein (cluster 1, maltose/g3p/polyamine/iron) [Ktedonobacterales bacterium]|jgi:alpha-glucoside transport system substrate-binding protein|nr:MAG: ABC transporter, substrate-binding protein (cluster 1, maltose/g3p/polyamine/iron) [Ktedonobacterales bacterium]